MFKIPTNSIRKLYLKSLWSVLPYSIPLAGLYTLIEPNTKPTLADTTDWIALVLFFFGLFILFFLHACIVYQLSLNLLPEASHKKLGGLKDTLQFGLSKIMPVALIFLAYVLLVSLGLLALVIPGIYLFLVGSFSLFLIVLKDIPVKEALIESYRLAYKHWFTVAIFMIALVLGFTAIEWVVNLIFHELVVFSSLLFILARGVLWPLWYAGMMILLVQYGKGIETQTHTVSNKSLNPQNQNN